MTNDPVCKMILDGYGWEDICVRFGVRDQHDRMVIRRMVLNQAQQRQEVRADTS